METIIKSIDGYKGELKAKDFECDKSLYEKYPHSAYVLGYIGGISGTYRLKITTEDEIKLEIIVNNHDPAMVIPGRKIFLRKCDFDSEEGLPSFWLNGILDPYEEAENERKAKLQEEKVTIELHRSLRNLYQTMNLSKGDFIHYIKVNFDIDANEVFEAIKDL